MARKTHTLAAARASDCRACSSRTTKAAWCKRRSKRPSTSSFQLVETALNFFCPIVFWAIATFCHRQMGQNFRFHHIFVLFFIYERGVYLGFTAQRHKLLSNCRSIKGQDGSKKCCFETINVFCFLIALVWFAVSKRLSSIRFVTGIVPYLILFLLLLIL